MSYTNKEVNLLALVHNMEAASNAIHEVLVTSAMSQRSKQLLKRSRQANEIFLKEFKKKSNQEADIELEGQGSLIYELSRKLAIVPDQLIDQFSQDLKELCNTYNEAITAHYNCIIAPE